MHVLLRGKRWRLLFASLKREQCIGRCDSPTKRGKRIRVCTTIDEPQTLEVLTHEMLHACFWDMDEEAINESARDIAKVLWDLGYRRNDATT